jgi:AraC-like DNA-binding protein
MYREYPAPAPLAGLVECFWRSEFAEPGSDESGVVLPDGRVDLIWTGDGTTLVAGPQRRFLARPLEPPFVAIGARFHPGVGPPLLGLAAHELVDSHVPLAAVDTRPAAALERRLAAVSDEGHAFRAFDEALAGLADRAEAVDALVRGAARMLDNEPDTTIGDLAAELALSERQLQRRFREAVGYGPKTLQRILRFRRLLAELRLGRAGAGGLARIAASTGYADQAHMTREARDLSGLSPLQLERLWRA